MTGLHTDLSVGTEDGQPCWPVVEACSEEQQLGEWYRQHLLKEAGGLHFSELVQSSVL